MSSPMPTISGADSARVAATVLAPLAARGVIVRRPRVTTAVAAIDADRRAVRLLQRLRRRYGSGPLRLAIPGRELALVLSAADARRVLAETPDPYSPANREKRAALAQFEPRGVLISPPPDRPRRRRINESALDTASPVHRLAATLTETVREEATALAGSPLDWNSFAATWWRIVRRITLGDSARDDEEITDRLRDLRRAANWSYLRPVKARARAEFLAALASYAARAEPGSLIAQAGPDPEAAGQVPQWLFAFDAAGMASYRTLALLAAHPDHAERARGDDGPEYPFLRACVLDSLRLWPTTPVILRDSTVETRWDRGTLPAGTALAIYAPFLHRDDETLVNADRFDPDQWLDQREPDQFVPFSAGPAECPGRNVVLLTTTTLLAALREKHDYDPLPPHQLDPARPLPGTLSPFPLRFGARPV